MKLKRGVLIGIALGAVFWGLLVAGAFSFYFKVPESLWESMMPLPKSGEKIAVLEARKSLCWIWKNLNA